MSQQVIASAKKDFWASFSVPLASYPVACKIANITLFSELLSDKTILAFGKYDLVFCYRKEENELTPGYHAAVIARTFCESIKLIGAGIPGTPPGDIEVRAYFSRPPRVHIRPGKPAQFKLCNFVKSIVSYLAWVEAQVEGEITAEITLAPKISQEPLRVIPEGEIPGGEGLYKIEESRQSLNQEEKKEKPPESKKGASGEKEGEAGLQKGAKRAAAAEEPVELPAQEASAKKAAADTRELSIDPEMLADLVMKIIRRREQENLARQESTRRGPEKAGGQTGFAAPTVVTVPDPGFSALPLEQIPSRPGLSTTFVPAAPPPKPPGKSG